MRNPLVLDDVAKGCDESFASIRAREQSSRLGLLVVLYVAGASRLPILGRGKGHA